MRKKYSDPLMFPSVLLTGIDVNESDNGEVGPDGLLSSKAKRLAAPKLNAAPAEETSNSVMIVDPVEETGNSAGSDAADMLTEGTSEAEPVIDMLVPDETTAPAEAGE